MCTNHYGNSRSELCWCSQINLILATFRALLMWIILVTRDVQSSVDVHKSTWYLQRSELCWCARIILVLATFSALLMCTNHLGNSRRSELCWCARINLIKTQRRSELCLCSQISFTFTHDFQDTHAHQQRSLCMIRFHKHSWCSSLINALYRTSAFNAKPHDVYGWCYAAHITLARFRCKLQQDINLLGIHKDDHIIHSRASAPLNISWLSVSIYIPEILPLVSWNLRTYWYLYFSKVKKMNYYNIIPLVY
jgi:hypothetical protein